MQALCYINTSVSLLLYFSIFFSFDTSTESAYPIFLTFSLIHSLSMVIYYLTKPLSDIWKLLSPSFDNLIKKRKKNQGKN